jgi:hypothetical protein
MIIIAHYSFLTMNVKNTFDPILDFGLVKDFSK